MTRYDESFVGLKVLFDKENISNTIGEVLSISGKSQLRIAETEKYPHVTFFFNGGREKPFSNEKEFSSILQKWLPMTYNRNECS